MNLKKLQKFYSSYFRSKNHFKENGSQNYLVFQPMYKYFKKISNTEVLQNVNLKDCLMKS